MTIELSPLLTVACLGVVMWLLGRLVRMMGDLARTLIVLTDRVDDLYADDPEPKVPEDKPVDQDQVVVELRSRKAS